VYYNPEGNYNFGRMKDNKSLDKWHRIGHETDTEFADPLFVDRKNHDYRLKSKSPALELGFQQINTSEIGLKKDFPYKDDRRLSMKHRHD
jgi:hypothetical protein